MVKDKRRPKSGGRSHHEHEVESSWGEEIDANGDAESVYGEECDRVVGRYGHPCESWNSGSYYTCSVDVIVKFFLFASSSIPASQLLLLAA